MKKTVVILIGLVTISAIVVIVFPGVRDELHWRCVCLKDKAEDYAGYLKSWPSGHHVPKAKKLYDEKSWLNAKEKNTIKAFEIYLNNQPEGKYVSEAKDMMDSLLWQQANGENTIVSYQKYIDVQPPGRFVSEAKSKKESLSKDDSYYLSAQNQGTRRAYETFLEQFPGHKLESYARAALRDMEGRDIVDLLNQRKIQAKTSGSGIKSVNLKLKRRTKYEVTVKIPVGTFFVCLGSAQNMVATREKKVVLQNDDWISVSVDVACADRTRDIPYGEESFNIQRSPKQNELQKLMPVLRNANVSFAVQQAAIWIVTDNADYDDLGLLVSRAQFQVFGGTRLINEDEAAEAMKTCHEAGIDITKKAIWGDRDEIIKGLDDEGLKGWLQKKAKK